MLSSGHPGLLCRSAQKLTQTQIGILKGMMHRAIDNGKTAFPATSILLY